VITLVFVIPYSDLIDMAAAALYKDAELPKDDVVDALIYGLTNASIPKRDYGIPLFIRQSDESDAALRERIKSAYSKEILVVQLEDFINLVKKIVLLWAENLDDSDIRVAMIELHERPD
jgi:hypothetical protein